MTEMLSIFSELQKNEWQSKEILKYTWKLEPVVTQFPLLCNATRYTNKCVIRTG